MTIDKTTNEFLMQAGGKAFSFEKMDDIVIGEVITAEVRQQTDVETGERLTWNDGSPRNQLVITLQTTLSNSDDDDGVRQIFAKGGKHDVAEGEGTSMKDAIAKAVRDGGGTGLNPGDQLAVAWTGTGLRKNRAFNAKLYSASWKPAPHPGVGGRPTPLTWAGGSGGRPRRSTNDGGRTTRPPPRSARPVGSGRAASTATATGEC
jgi:hypothetical protein